MAIQMAIQIWQVAMDGDETVEYGFMSFHELTRMHGIRVVVLLIVINTHVHISPTLTDFVHVRAPRVPLTFEMRPRAANFNGTRLQWGSTGLYILRCCRMGEFDTAWPGDSGV